MRQYHLGLPFQYLCVQGATGAHLLFARILAPYM
jgi:hypothetical protein